MHFAGNSVGPSLCDPELRRYGLVWRYWSCWRRQCCTAWKSRESCWCGGGCRGVAEGKIWGASCFHEDFIFRNIEENERYHAKRPWKYGRWGHYLLNWWLMEVTNIIMSNVSLLCNVNVSHVVYFRYGLIWHLRLKTRVVYDQPLCQVYLFFKASS